MVFGNIVCMNAIQIPSVESLQSEVTCLQGKNAFLQNTNAVLQNQVTCLEEQLNWFKRQLFGKRSERIVSDVNSEQLVLEGFEDPTPVTEEQKKTVQPHTRRKPRRNGQDKITLSPELPVESTVLDISEEEKVCKETGTSLVKIGEEITHKLACKPSHYYIKEIIRPKYAHPQREEEGIRIAELPDSIIPRCRADESFLADIVTKKFADHLEMKPTFRRNLGSMFLFFLSLTFLV